MARGKKSYTLVEQLERTTSEIEDLEIHLKELKRSKKELEEQIKLNRLSELDKLIAASGKSFEEIKEFLGINLY
ncbi:flagellar export protein FliJ [bacterium 1XD42-8]|jgi:hypothetical protein|nr:flagellar export protein FliJ [Lachnospiraceae bacterium]RKJ37827.1 flagellar export protein FliJ [bacterium 1XD42-8]